jgi:uncharacterized ion transporter superfamily protein YfcC
MEVKIMKKMMKKYNLLTAIAVCFIIYVVLSWFIPTGAVTDSKYAGAGTNPVGLFGLVYYPGITSGTFLQFGLIILAIGALYGVMNKTGAYGTIVNNVVSKFKGKEKTFLVVTVALLIIISSLIGLPYAIMILVPFLMAVLLKLGYNKITTVASTVGSILVGQIGSTFGYTIAGISANLLGLKINDGILSRLALLVIVLFLFVLFVTGNKEAKVNGVKKESNKKGKKETISHDVSESKVIFLEEVSPNKKTFALELLLILTFLVAFVSMFNWNTVFKITVFEDFYEKITAIKVSGYPIFKHILGLTNPFGYWDSYELVALLAFSSLLIGWVYNLSLVDIFEGMKSGARRVLRPACIIMIANIVFTLTLSASSGTMLVYITEKLGTISDSFNLFTTALTGIIGGFFYNNYYYYFNTIVTDLTTHVDAKYFNIMTFILQSIYGLMMMILPTSLVLVSGLSMLGVSFKEWIGYIWRFIVQLLVIILIISVILVLVV